MVAKQVNDLCIACWRYRYQQSFKRNSILLVCRILGPVRIRIQDSKMLFRILIKIIGIRKSWWQQLPGLGGYPIGLPELDPLPELVVELQLLPPPLLLLPPALVQLLTQQPPRQRREKNMTRSKEIDKTAVLRTKTNGLLIADSNPNHIVLFTWNRDPQRKVSDLNMFFCC